ncbi:hypothetical protein ABTM58_20680, partial [Acinetobacter baumannii]
MGTWSRWRRALPTRAAMTASAANQEKKPSDPGLSNANPCRASRIVTSCFYAFASPVSSKPPD